MFVPHLCGRVNPSSLGLRGAWAGLDWSHTATDLYRSVLESVALEYAIYQAAILRQVPSLRMRQLRVTGGGQRSRLWNRIKADVLQMPVVAIAGGEGAAMGSAMLAGFGVGAFGSLGEVADRWVRMTAGTRPDKSMAGHYSRRIRQYQALLEQLDELGRASQ